MHGATRAILWVSCQARTYHDTTDGAGGQLPRPHFFPLSRPGGRDGEPGHILGPSLIRAPGRSPRSAPSANPLRAAAGPPL